MGERSNISWTRSTIAQCKAAGVACFVKQIGSAPFERKGECGYRRLPDDDLGRRYGFPDLKDRAGADPAEWPADLNVQEFPA